MLRSNIVFYIFVFTQKIHYGCTRTRNNQAGQRHIIDTAIKLGCTGLALAPNSIEQKEIVSQLKRKNIPTVFIDRDIGGERVSVIKTENFIAGEKAAIEMVKALNGKGKIAVLRTNPNVMATTARENGFIHAATEQGLEIMVDQYIGTRIGEARKNAYNILKESPSIDGVFTPNESSSIAVIRVLEQLNKAGKLIHIGFDAPQLMIDALKANHIYGFMMQDPFQIGYQGVYAVYNAMQGKTVKKLINTQAIFIHKGNISLTDI
jgi:ribose transport system substrate-binding protein